MPEIAPRYRIFVSRRGNVFMVEIARLIAHAFADAGRQVELIATELPWSEDGVVNLAVSPQEIFTLARADGVAETLLEDMAASSVCITVDQPGNEWFEQVTRWCVASPLVLDISAVAAEELRRHGIEAKHLRLGYHRTLDFWNGDPNRTRPVDLTFMGTATPRRLELLARAAALLWGRKAELRLFSADRPVTGPDPYFLAGEEKLRYFASCKVLLHLHRSETPYFEWLRVVQALSNGCALVAEEAPGSEPLLSFEHYVSVPAEAASAYAAALLLDEPWRERLAHDAYELLREELDMVATARSWLGELDSYAFSLPRRSRRQPVDSPSFIPALGDYRVRPISGGDRGRLPPGIEGLIPLRPLELSALATLKDLLLSSRRLARSVEALEAKLGLGTPFPVEVEKTPAFDQVEPEVSVVLTVYDYESFVGEAVDSVLASRGVVAELLVVDDNSRDGSVDAVRAKLAANPWFPIALVRKPANQGLPAARNTGFRLARSEYVFVLDADNLVYPTCLATLRDALVASDTAAAYGILEVFGRGESLLSYLPWQVDRLVQGNYVDAMAMLRRSAWRDAGGYDESPAEPFWSWEDYELWLRLAEAGRSAVSVPIPVGRYRVHEQSMTTLCNLDVRPLFDAIRRAHPGLPWPEAIPGTSDIIM